MSGGGGGNRTRVHSRARSFRECLTLITPLLKREKPPQRPVRASEGLYEYTVLSNVVYNREALGRLQGSESAD